MIVIFTFYILLSLTKKVVKKFQFSFIW